jgi:hypothetical protein
MLSSCLAFHQQLRLVDLFVCDYSQVCIQEGRVGLVGKIGGRSLQFDVSVRLAPDDPTLSVHRLAAKAKIQEMQDLNSCVI